MYLVQVCEQKKLYKLPRDPSVAQILEQYQTSVEKIGKNGVGASDRLRYSVSIQEYFESYCRTHLLYDDRERRQYDRIIKDDRFDSCSDFYGAEHLLRLMSKLPDLIFGIPGKLFPQFSSCEISRAARIFRSQQNGLAVVTARQRCRSLRLPIITGHQNAISDKLQAIIIF